MYSGVHNYIVDKIKNATIYDYPFLHLIVDDIFPTDFYNLLLENKLSDLDLYNLKDINRVGTGYSDSRKVLNLEPEMPQLKNNYKEFYENFAKYMHYHFQSLIMKKFKLSLRGTKGDLLYTRDTKNYSLGPHTDKTSKLLTCLIYLPMDDKHSFIGTSVYTPKITNFKCKGGPHYKSSNFDLVKTINYIPNRMFCFLKTDNSFHGVEPVTVEVERNLLIFDIQKA